jgi:ABC-type branched-subunit amino acid transport system substrate-binding protein
LVIAGVAVIVGACGGGGSATLRGASVGTAGQGQAAPAPAIQGTGGSRDQSPAQPGAAAAQGQPAQQGQPVQPNAQPAGNGTPHLPPAPVPPGRASLPVGPGANPASDVGVTADTISIGIINMASANRSLGPPIALASQRVTDGLVRYINETGGVAGRKLRLLTCDDGGDVTRARACYERLKTQVFALVPSETFVTDVIHDTLAKDRVPWMTWGWFKSEYQDPYMFPCHANGLREAHNLAQWVATQMHPQTVGIMYLNVSEDIAAKDEAIRTLQQYGVRVVQSVSQEWDSPDESQHVLAMRVANPDHVISFSWPAPVVKFMHDAEGQNWAPRLGFSANHLTGDPGYGALMGDYIKDRLTTITSWEIPGIEKLPGLQLYRQVANRYAGNDLVGLHFRYAMGHHISQSGFVCTRILAQAAATMGPNLTRAGFMKALESTSYDSGMGVVLRWPHGDHGQEPYSFNREFLYRWVGAPDGGWDLKRILPDPVDIPA